MNSCSCCESLLRTSPQYEILILISGMSNFQASLIFRDQSVSYPLTLIDYSWWVLWWKALILNTQVFWGKLSLSMAYRGSPYWKSREYRVWQRSVMSFPRQTNQTLDMLVICSIEVLKLETGVKGCLRKKYLDPVWVITLTLTLLMLFFFQPSFRAMRKGMLSNPLLSATFFCTLYTLQYPGSSCNGLLVWALIAFKKVPSELQMGSISFQSNSKTLIMESGLAQLIIRSALRY